MSRSGVRRFSRFAQRHVRDPMTACSPGSGSTDARGEGSERLSAVLRLARRRRMRAAVAISSGRGRGRRRPVRTLVRPEGARVGSPLRAQRAPAAARACGSGWWCLHHGPRATATQVGAGATLLAISGIDGARRFAIAWLMALRLRPAREIGAAGIAGWLLTPESFRRRDERQESPVTGSPAKSLARRAPISSRVCSPGWHAYLVKPCRGIFSSWRPATR